MKQLASLMIKAYQTYSATREPRCKYYPSCSNYAATAIRRHGVKGLTMAIWRLLRCNPWSAGGLDYVDYELDSADALANMRQRATSEPNTKTINDNRKTKEGVR